MKTQATKRQPVRRYYLLAVILMIAGLINFPFGGSAAMDPNALAVSVALIALSVGCAIRGRRNGRGE